MTAGVVIIGSWSHIILHILSYNLYDLSSNAML